MLVPYEPSCPSVGWSVCWFVGRLDGSSAVRLDPKSVSHNSLRLREVTLPRSYRSIYRHIGFFLYSLAAIFLPPLFLLTKHNIRPINTVVVAHQLSDIMFHGQSCFLFHSSVLWKWLFPVFVRQRKGFRADKRREYIKCSFFILSSSSISSSPHPPAPPPPPLPCSPSLLLFHFILNDSKNGELLVVFLI